jgi:hypothetical protein
MNCILYANPSCFSRFEGEGFDFEMTTLIELAVYTACSFTHCYIIITNFVAILESNFIQESLQMSLSLMPPNALVGLITFGKMVRKSCIKISYPLDPVKTNITLATLIIIIIVIFIQDTHITCCTVRVFQWGSASKLELFTIFCQYLNRMKNTN